MIVVPVKEGENIEKALKKFKRKFEKTGIVKELRTIEPTDPVFPPEDPSYPTDPAVPSDDPGYYFDN